MEKPIIYCIDTTPEVVSALRSNNFNVQEGTLGKKIPTSTEEHIIHPRADVTGLQEADIVLINNQKPNITDAEYPDREERPMEEQVILKPRSQNYFDPRPYFQNVITKYIKTILERGGLVLIPAVM